MTKEERAAKRAAKKEAKRTNLVFLLNSKLSSQEEMPLT